MNSEEKSKFVKENIKKISTAKINISTVSSVPSFGSQKGKSGKGKC